MRSYWNRICIYYRDLTRYKMDADILMDVSNIYIILIFLSCSYILIAAIVDSKSLA
jgi:hypothetical protein